MGTLIFFVAVPCRVEMLCELSASSNFLVMWGVLTLLGLVSQLVLSGTAFYYLYVRASYATWRYKLNPKYPSAQHVKLEITEMLKSLVFATLCPAAALWLTQAGYGNAYCGLGGYSWSYLLGSTVGVVVVSDWFESTYHWAGHAVVSMWSVHKAHHRFPNPTPFAVIADEAPDQLMRSLPLLAFPLLLPVNMDMLFVVYSVLFYAYGTYIHSGHSAPWILSAHNGWINTSYHHYLHHALSIKNKPYHIGFFIQAWDKLYGSQYDKDCFCIECQHSQGKRTQADFAQVVVPDYSVLLSPSFWFDDPNPKLAKAH